MHGAGLHSVTGTAWSVFPETLRTYPIFSVQGFAGLMSKPQGPGAGGRGAGKTPAPASNPEAQRIFQNLLKPPGIGARACATQAPGPRPPGLAFGKFICLKSFDLHNPHPQAGLASSAVYSSAGVGSNMSTAVCASGIQTALRDFLSTAGAPNTVVILRDVGSRNGTATGAPGPLRVSTISVVD